MTTDETLTPTDQNESAAPANAGPASDNSATETPSLDVQPSTAPEAIAPDATDQPAPAEVPSTNGMAPAVPAPKPAVAPARSADDDAKLFEAAMRELDYGEGSETEGSFKKLSKGDRVEATVIQVDRDRVFVDLGTKSEGIVPLNELSEDNLDTAEGQVAIGDKINVVVLRPEGADGNPIVSKKRADFEEIWDRIERAHRSGEMIKAQVIDRVKGGLVVDVGVRGFVPATHVGSGKLRNIEKYVGNALDLKVIEIDRDRKKVVLSNREAEELRRAKAKEDIFENVNPGDILDGTVRRLTDYGAFVDLGGVDGLLHISEMSWARINHPKEMFKEGQKIKVMVLRLDSGAGKISLGHRQVLPDPWNLIKDNYKVGQTLKVPIGRIVQSGAFIRLPEGAEAFLPVSEMSSRRIKRPQDVVEENQEVEVQIIDLRPDERRMVLSMRALGGGGDAGVGYQRREAGGPPSGGFDDEFRDRRGGGPGVKGKKGGKKGGGGGRGRDYEDDFEESVGRRGFATGGATIGERLGMLKGLLGRDDEIEDEPEADLDADTEPSEAPEAAPKAEEAEEA
jgi:predicted RNA-binding protein with RPS1 domain